MNAMHVHCLEADLNHVSLEPLREKEGEREKRKEARRRAREQREKKREKRTRERKARGARGCRKGRGVGGPRKGQQAASKQRIRLKSEAEWLPWKILVNGDELEDDELDEQLAADSAHQRMMLHLDLLLRLVDTGPEQTAP